MATKKNNTESKTTRTYKSSQTDYNKAINKANKRKDRKTLAGIVSEVVSLYSKGYSIHCINKKGETVVVA